MAVYHQPFAILEDAVIRAAGFMLLGCSLQAYCAKDGVRNGLANLDMFAKAGMFGLDSALAALKPALLAWNFAPDTVNRPPGLSASPRVAALGISHGLIIVFDAQQASENLLLSAIH